MPVKTEQKTTKRYDPRSGRNISETEGRDLDPTGSLAVDEKMKKTDLGALARAAAEKKKRTGQSMGDALAGARKGGY